MTTSTILPQIQAIIAAVNTKRDALEDYKQKLDKAKAELDKARSDRQKSFSFDTDKKVVELEGFVSRIDARYTEEKQLFDNELPDKLNEVEQLFSRYVGEKWRGDKEVEALTQKTIESFKQTVKLLDEYHSKPQEINDKAMQEIVTDDFKKAFRGQMTFIGADRQALSTAIPLEGAAYPMLYSAGRQLGVTFDEL